MDIDMVGGDIRKQRANSIGLNLGYSKRAGSMTSEISVSEDVEVWGANNGHYSTLITCMGPP